MAFSLLTYVTDAVTTLQHTRRDAMTKRTYETAKLTPGQKITSSGFPGSVVRLYSDGEVEGARMYEIRLPGGIACVCGSDIIPA
jgi:hypothetical protein